LEGWGNAEIEETIDIAQFATTDARYLCREVPSCDLTAADTSLPTRPSE
jgi:hypothetical protein